MLELNNIYQGDSLKLFKQVDSNSIDLIIADPPYGISKDFGNGDSWSLEKHEEWFNWEKLWLDESKRVLRPNGNTRLITVAMAAIKSSIAKQDDVNFLELVGLDANTPQVISSFTLGDF